MTGSQQPPPAKPILLGYANAALSPRWSKAAIACFILGLISGPSATFLAVMTSMNSLDEPTKETLAKVTFFGILAVILAAQIAFLCRLNRHGWQLRGRALIIAGIVATCSWPVVIVAWLYIVLQTASI